MPQCQNTFQSVDITFTLDSLRIELDVAITYHAFRLIGVEICVFEQTEMEKIFVKLMWENYSVGEWNDL